MISERIICQEVFEEHAYEKYLKEKQQLSLPPNVSLFLESLEICFLRSKEYSESNLVLKFPNNHQAILKKLKQNSQAKNLYEEEQLFIKGFQKFSAEQKIDFLSQLVCQLNPSYKREVSLMKEDGQIFQVICFLKNHTCCFDYWSGIILLLNKKKNNVTIIQSARIYHICLRQYFIRKSESTKLSFILENTYYSLSPELQTMEISFKEEDKPIFLRLFEEIKKITYCTKFESFKIKMRFERQIFQKSKQRKGFDISPLITVEALQRLESVKNFKQLRNIKDMQNSSSSLKRLSSMTKQSDYRLIFQTENLIIEQSINQKLYFKVCFLLQSLEKIKNLSFIQIFGSSHKDVHKMNIMETITNENQLKESIYQKILHNKMVYSQILLLKEYKTSQTNKVTQIINIDHEQNRSIINFMLISHQQLDKNILSNHATRKYQIYIEFKRNYEISDDFYLQFLKELFNMFKKADATRPSSQVSEDVINKLLGGQKTSKFSRATKNKLSEGESQYEQLINIKDNRKIGKSQSSVLEDEKIQNAYLNHIYRLNPTESKIGKIKPSKPHFLYNDWKRGENGGLVCKDEELVEKQKGYAKQVLKQFGKHLFSGKNIINFSLPVIIFKKESHLMSLGKSYLYAPIFTQKAAKQKNPVQRMKYSLFIMMTENVLSIHMQKPFNPIIGQTYQGWIDGCPIYLQQISHHPPISSYYFVGRGFKKYGSIQPKISMSLNGALGYSTFPHIVQFDDGTKIQYICAPMKIGGLFIGQRTFMFQDKMYAYDRSNRYFASLSFGPINSGFFSSSSEPEDYFHGYIYEVTPEFQLYFDQQCPKRHPEEKHIVKKLTFFDGIWNSSINVNGEQIINFKTDLPYQFIQEKYPLPSDSKYRTDLQQLLKGNLETAQTQKQKLQDAQRDDRKLREQYEKTLK